MKKQKMNPKTILPLFDEFLASKGASFRAIVIGGGALSVMGVIPRMTVDFDVLDPEIPKNILSLSHEFLEHAKSKDIPLGVDWINNGPIEIRNHLPSNWKNRVEKIFEGKAITFFTLGRSDLLKTKLDACLTRVQPDLSDLLHLKPSREELFEARQWLMDQDAGAEREKHINQMYHYIANELGYEL